MSLFLGIDVGTQGVRAVLINASGEEKAASSKRFAAEDLQLPDGWSEQDPGLWWEKTRLVISEIVRNARQNNTDIKELKTVAVTSTSGTVIPLDNGNNILRRAIMYNDSRAADEANILNIKGGGLCKKLGYAFNSSFALSKLLWIKKNEPDIFSKTVKFVSPADYIVGKITGNFSISDTSNVLKTGYDLIDKKWPSFFAGLGIEQSILPEVKIPGEIVGEVRKEIEDETGLPRGTAVCAGATDGVASFFASGAALPGEWNSTLGTTLVVKGVSEEMLKDKLGRFYSHLHPQGWWLPGGASSCGGEALKLKFKGNLALLDEDARKNIPTNIIVYPLVRKGERFPFVNGEAQGFMIGRPESKNELYAAYLEGVGLVERWIYDIIEELGGKVGDMIYVSGGASKSEVWLRIRANILNKLFIMSKIPEACFGAALIAASKTFFQDISQAVKAMVKQEREILPDKEMVKIYDTKYRKFRCACDAIGYV